MEINKIQEEEGGGGKPVITAVGGGGVQTPHPLHIRVTLQDSYHAASVASGFTLKTPGSDSKGARNRGDFSILRQTS